jgi:DEAD/DEAH box helicase domain-containing protein
MLVRADLEAPDLLCRLLGSAAAQERVTHVERLPARLGQPAAWPAWTPPELVARWQAAGVDAPWSHQVRAAEAAYAGRSVVVATGTASGKSLAYQLPVVTSVSVGGATALYLSPTKALAGDQLRVLRELDPDGLRAAAYDGDTPREHRTWARAHANLVLTNPDMLHRSLLPSHARWARFLRRLEYVVVDECHRYRGVFGSHVATLLRRLRRVCAHYRAEPTFVLASATIAEPAAFASRLVGRPVEQVVDDGSPRGALTFALWEPPLTERAGERGTPLRRSATAEAADLLAGLAVDGVQTLAFVPSRRGAEATAMSARRSLADVAPDLAERVAAYRAGYLPEERRALERRLASGDLLGLAATNALELGIDVAGLDAVLLCGYPGTLASLWQQAGRAGRTGGPALAVFVARDDPLDTFLVRHPEALFGRPVEASVLDPDNPYVLAPQLRGAAEELPLTDADLPAFGTGARACVDDLVERGLLRRRRGGWYATRRPAGPIDIRSVAGEPVRVVEDSTGALLGTVDAAAAPATVHAGAVYLHQGTTYVVRSLDLDDAVALAVADEPDWTTWARSVTDVHIAAPRSRTEGAGVTLSFGEVDVTSRVVSFQRRRIVTGEVLGEEPLDLPARRLPTRAVWWTLAPELLEAAAVSTAQLAGAVHAAEHAAIGLLPLFATCDRWDIGGVSTPLHPDTGAATVVVYDGHPGGAGFAERGFGAGARWLTATGQAVAACGCAAGCPSCVYSPKCGNGNDPLDKPAAGRLLAAISSGLGA